MPGPYRSPRGDQRVFADRARSRACGRRLVGSALAGGQPARSDRRRAGLDQGQYLGQGPADAARLENQRSGAGRAGFSGGRAPARAGRRHSRQDLHARTWLDRRLSQSAHRHHAQSMEPRSYARRLDRRRGGGRAAGSGRAASGNRRRRLAAHPGRLHRRIRHEAELRPGADLPAIGAQRARAPGTDHAHRGRCRADAVGDRAAGFARHDGLEHAGAGF